jgi:DNA-binding transcriptional regulator YhcF (GntR family)
MIAAIKAQALITKRYPKELISGWRARVIFDLIGNNRYFQPGRLLWARDLEIAFDIHPTLDREITDILVNHGSLQKIAAYSYKKFSIAQVKHGPPPVRIKKTGQNFTEKQAVSVTELQNPHIDPELIPSYLKIAISIINNIRENILVPGSRLPQISDIARKFNVKRSTVKKAMKELRGLDYIVTERNMSIIQVVESFPLPEKYKTSIDFRKQAAARTPPGSNPFAVWAEKIGFDPHETLTSRISRIVYYSLRDGVLPPGQQVTHGMLRAFPVGQIRASQILAGLHLHGSLERQGTKQKNYFVAEKQPDNPPAIVTNTPGR